MRSLLCLLFLANLLRAQPANDAFTNRLALSGTFVAWNGTLVGATAEPGEPPGGIVAPTASVWYEWRAPLSGAVEMEFTLVEFVGSIGVFQGTNLNTLVAVTNGVSPSAVRFPARGGEAYHIVVDTSSGLTGGFAMQLALTPSAPNDNFAKAARLSGLGGWAQGSNTAATVEAGEPRHLGANGPFGRSLWWNWNAPAHGLWRIDASPLPTNTALAVYSGTSVSNLVLLASNRFTSTLEVRVTRGVDYFVAVDHTNQALMEFGFVLAAAPPNDFFADRIPLLGNTGAVVATTVTASAEPGEPGSIFPPPATVWWTWTAPSTSPLNFRFSDETHLLEAYTNSTLGSLRLLTPFDFVSQGLGRYVMANIRAGVTYQFRVRPNSAPGPFSFVWFQNSALTPNDHLANREMLVGTNVSVAGTLSGATREAGEPIHGSIPGVGSLWYGWKAPANGSIRFTLTNAGFNVAAACYRGTNYGALVLVGTADTFLNPTVGFSVSAGVDYSIAIDSPSYGDPFRFLLSYAPAPSNDNFTNRIVLSGDDVLAAGSTAGAGKESGEPNHAGSTSRTGTIWYTWQTALAGPVTIIASGPAIDPVLAVYTGNQVNALGPIASNNDYLSNGLRDSRVTFNAVAGVPYHIAVATTPIAPGDVTLRISRNNPPAVAWLQPAADLVLPAGAGFALVADAADSDGSVSEVQLTRGGQSIATFSAPPYGVTETNLPYGTHSYRAYAVDNAGFITSSPARQVRVAPGNDFFTNRFVIPSDALSVSGTLSGTTRDTNEVRQLSTSQRVAWWTWTAPTNGMVYLTISNSSSRAVSIYSGSSLGALVLAATSANARYAALEVEEGMDYQIAAEAATDGDIVLSFEAPLFAANDHFANAITISGTNSVVQGLNTEATSEPGEPNHGGTTASRSLWWNWTAPANGLVQLKTAGSAFDTILGVYTGASVSNLALVVSNQTSSFNGNSAVTFTANAGTLYRIAVDAYSGFGNAILSLEFFSIPANDLFSQRIQLVGRTNLVFGNNIAAGPRETGEPNPTIFGAGKTLWWSWTAPAAGRVFFRAESTDVRSVIGVFTGASLPSLSTVTSAVNLASPTNSGQFNAIAGVTYHFQLDSRSGFAGDLSLSILQPNTPSNDDFAQRIPLEGYPANVMGDNFNATREPGEPTHDASQNGTVWWSWTAPETRHVSVVVQGAVTPKVAVYEGAALNALALVATNYLNGSPVGAATFHAVAGVTYQFAFFLAVGQMAPFQFSVIPNEPPVVQLVSPLSGSVYRVGEAIPLVANAVDSDGTISNVQFSAAGFSQLDSSAPFTTAVTNLTPGNYSIAARAVDNRGAFSLATPIAIRVSPLNDDFADAAVISGTSAQVTAQNIGASVEAGEPEHAARIGGRSIWYSWVAPVNGRFAFSTEGSSFDTLLAVYTGANVASLTLVASNDNRDAFETWSELQFQATAGMDYFVAIDGYAAETGAVTLILHPVAENDLFTNATPLAGHVTLRTRNLGAGEESGEPMQAGVISGSSLWWTWTAPASGRYLATTAGSDFDTVLGVFIGQTVSNLTLIGADDDATSGKNSVVRFDAIGGQEYHLAVSGFGSAEGEIQFTVATNGVPTLFEPRKSGATNFVFRALAEPGTTNVAQRSSTFSNWTSFQTIVATNWWTDFQDTVTNGFIFHRIIQP